MELKRLHVDNVGSMLRPAALREAYAGYVAGELSGAALTAAEDEAIRDLIAAQEGIGFPVVVDGEFRRTSYMDSFAEVEGAEDWVSRRNPPPPPRAHAPEEGAAGATDPVLLGGLRKPARARLRLKRNEPLAEWRFAQEQATVPAKVTILGPDRIASLHELEHPDDVYADADEAMADIVAVEREIVSQLVEAGCKYVHVDEPGFTAYVDDASLEALRASGEDLGRTIERSVSANNEVIAGFPDDVAFGVHLCRGNRESQWHREGAYDAIAETILGGLEYDRLLLEYDSERAGGFEPLRFVREDAVVVLGLLTTKTGELEPEDEIKRRIEEASAFVPVDRLALSTQCGFASSMAGNLLDEAEQWRKLERVLAVADEVWGGPVG